MRSDWAAAGLLRRWGSSNSNKSTFPRFGFQTWENNNLGKNRRVEVDPGNPGMIWRENWSLWRNWREQCRKRKRKSSLYSQFLVHDKGRLNLQRQHWNWATPKNFRGKTHQGNGAVDAVHYSSWWLTPVKVSAISSGDSACTILGRSFANEPGIQSSLQVSFTSGLTS